MIIKKTTKVDVNMKLVDEIVRAYFACLKENKLKLSCSEISELMRYSMCKMLNLQSKGYSAKVEECSKLVVNSISCILQRYNVNELSSDYKAGLLEACVHCMELSRKKVIA
jgi:hypothetical protein